MPDRSVFLNFIGYCIETFSPIDLTTQEWRKFLKNIDSASDEEVKSKALTLYYIRVAVNKECLNATPLLKLPHETIRDYIIAADKHREKYKLSTTPFTFYTVDKMVTKDIKSMQSEKGTSALDKILKSPTKTVKSKTVKKSPSEPKKSVTKTKVSKIKTKSPKSSKSPSVDKSPKARAVSKKNTAGKMDKSPKAKAVSKKVAPKRVSKRDDNGEEIHPLKLYKNCNRFTVAQLRKMANDAGLDIPEGSKKADICAICTEAGLLDIVINVKEEDVSHKFNKDRYVYDTTEGGEGADQIIIGIKTSGKYAPLTVDDRNLLSKLKKPFRFATNKEINALYFFADMPQQKIPYNHLGNKDKNHMLLPAVPVKERFAKKRDDVNKSPSPSVIEKKRVKNATKNAVLEARFASRQILPKRV